MAKKEDDKKKGLFGKAIDAISTRDEKEAVEKAEQAKKEAETKAAQAAIAAKKAEKAVGAAEKRAAQAEAKAKKLEAEMARKKAEERKAELLKRVKAAQVIKTPKFLAKHKIASGETLSHLALKYYNHATKPYYMLIYEANKDTIGDNPNLVKIGMVLDIPELPDDLKD